MPYADGKILQDSEYAAHLLAQKVMCYKNSNTIVVGVGPSGSSVGQSLAKELNLPFEVVLCRDIKHPANERKIIGSVSDGAVVMCDDTDDIPQDFLMRHIINLKHEIEHDYKTIYGNRPKPSFRNMTVIPVADVLINPDGLLAGIEAIKSHIPLKVIVAVPVVARHAAAKVAGQVNDFVFLRMEPGNLDEKNYVGRNSYIDLMKIKNSVISYKARSTFDQY